MRFRCHADFLACLSLLASCSGTVDVPAPSHLDPDAAVVQVQPRLSDGSVAPVFAIRAELSQPPLPRLFEGELSEYHLSRADNADLSNTLRAREVPLWVRRAGEVQQIAPLRWLDDGLEHSLVLSQSEVIRFVTGVGSMRLERRWPLRSAGRVAAYCRSDSEPLSGFEQAALEVELLDGARAKWQSLASDPACALLEVSSALSVAGSLSPVSAFGAFVEPTVFADVALSPPPSTAADELSCRGDEVLLGLGCLRAQDDRLLLRSPLYESLWVFSGDIQRVVAVQAGETVAVRGLQPVTHYAFSLTQRARDGATWMTAPSVITASPQPHMLISEVFANPTAREPAQEWVELFNDGADDVLLEGWILSDGVGDSLLPSARVSPGTHVVVVGDDFDEALWDVLPPAETLVVRVAEIGERGLSNAGEKLTLSTPSGRQVDSFPPVAAVNGVSVGRVWAQGAYARDVAQHAAPGSSPGMPNDVIEDVSN